MEKMEKIEYRLEIFEGPLDLLLHLIEKNRIDIFDINISEILEQYLDYIYIMEQADLYIASEFIDMVSRLLYIKSRLLLPKNESEPDPREELVKILLDYSEIKNIAEYLGELFEKYKGRYEKPEDRSILEMPSNEQNEQSDESKEIEEISVLNPEILYEILKQLAHRQRNNLPPPVEAIKLLTNRKPVTTAEKAIGVLRRLYKEGSADFLSLLNSASEIVATFTAILELLKTNRIFMIGEDLSECRFILNRESRIIT